MAAEAADIIAWLSSPAGERWSESQHGGFHRASRHSSAPFGEIKEDHQHGICNQSCVRQAGRAGRYTWGILADITKYGMNGVPPEVGKNREVNQDRQGGQPRG